MMKPISRLCIVLTITLHTMTAAQVVLTPGWKIASYDNATELCSLKRSDHSENTFIFHGNQDVFCSLHVNSSQYDMILVNFLNVSTTSDNNVVFFAEQLKEHDCPGENIVVKRQQSTCHVVLLGSITTTMNLLGDVSISLKTSALNQPQECPVYDQQNSLSHPESLVNNSIEIPCTNVEGFDEVITCNFRIDADNFYYPFLAHARVCKYHFEYDCKSTLRNNSEIKFDCPLSTSTIAPVSTFIVYQNVDIIDLSHNGISSIEDSTFVRLNQVKVLTMKVNQVDILRADTFKGLYNLEQLDLSKNKLRILDQNSFQGVPNLLYLYLSYNGALTELPSKVFRGLFNLTGLYIIGTNINYLSSEIFQDLSNLKNLNLARNMFTTLDEKLFHGLRKLNGLSLKKNYHLKHLPSEIFRDLENLHYIFLSKCNLKALPEVRYLTNLVVLGFEENPLLDIDGNVLSLLPKEAYVISSQHEIYECFVDSANDCVAIEERSPYLTCDRLLSDRVLVVLMWLIGLNALLGNLFVIVLNLMRSGRRTVQDHLLSNLAMSDLLMGIYMIMIASADVYFGDHFPMRADEWRSGTTCRIAGAVSIISSEASVFFVTLISIDRFINIQFPYSSKRLGRKSVALLIMLTWLFAFALGVAPSILSGNNFKFYDNSHVCIGLPLALTKQYETKNVKGAVTYVDGLLVHRSDVETVLLGAITGMYFATAVFLGLNGICYLFILLCYIGIVRAVRESLRSTGRTQEMKKQIQMTTKVIAIVATDFCCWFPVIILGVLVQLRLVTLPPSVFAWSVTFVLPINSAINPYLYTIAALIGKIRKQKKKDKSIESSSMDKNTMSSYDTTM